MMLRAVPLSETLGDDVGSQASNSENKLMLRTMAVNTTLCISGSDPTQGAIFWKDSIQSMMFPLVRKDQ